MKLKKNDNVKVVAGKDKGKTGKIEQVLGKEDKVLITGVNEYKRHKKGNAQGQKSEIVTINMPLSIAKVMLICPKCKLPTRVGFGEEKNKKVRICKKCNSGI